MSRRTRRKIREEAANHLSTYGGAVNNYADAQSVPGSGQDDYLRQQAFGLVGGVGQGEVAEQKTKDAEAVFRWLKYGPEEPADPTVQQIVADVVNSDRSLRAQIAGVGRRADSAQQVAEKALGRAEENDGAVGLASIIAVLALLVGVAALIIAIFS